MFETIMIKYVLPALIPTIGSFLTWGLAEMSKFFKVKKESEVASKAFKEVSEIVNVVVSDVAQGMASDIKEASLDGKLSKEEKELLKKQAVDKVFKHLPEMTKKTVSLSVNSLQNFIEDKIEQVVIDKK